MPPYLFTSDRLVFREWTDDDIENAWLLWGDPEVTRLIDARGQLTREQVRARLDEEVASGREHGVQYWALFLRETDELVGCCGLSVKDREQNIYELGFLIRSCHWRKGYAREAARRVIEHAFETLGASALFAGHNPANDPSRSLLATLGFVYTQDELYEPTGLMHPSYILRPSRQ
ncbi:MAG: GNAT family N-acetyltransferase [Phycisphaerales bacterium JB043]